MIRALVISALHIKKEKEIHGTRVKHGRIQAFSGREHATFIFYANKRVILLSTKSSSDENKKWQWLLRNLEVENVRLMSVDEFRKAHPNRSFAEPNREPVWTLQISEDLQKEFIIKKAPDCFVKWSEAKCNKNF